MTAVTHSRVTFFMRAAAPAIVLFLLIAVMLRFPPEQSGFYPQCPIHHFLGILCPGCGATRALAALLRGNIHEALRLNAFFVLIFPFVCGYAISYYLKFVARMPIRWPQPRPAAMYIALASVVVFTIVRNA